MCNFNVHRILLLQLNANHYSHGSFWFLGGKRLPILINHFIFSTFWAIKNHMVYMLVFIYNQGTILHYKNNTILNNSVGG